MKILVCAKRVVDTNVRVRVNSSNTEVETTHSKMSINPFDENAIEEAVKLKELNIVSEIVAVSIGNDKCSDTLRTAMARGCDRAILVEGIDNPEPIMVAKILKSIVNKEQPNLIMLGKQAIDDDANQVGQMLAGMLDYPQGTFISKLEISENKAIIQREIDSGTEILELTLPAVLTVDSYINNPRFIKLPQLMLAKKKNIEHIPLSSLNLELKPSVKLLKVDEVKTKRQCKMLNSADEVIAIIKKVIE